MNKFKTSEEIQEIIDRFDGCDGNDLDCYREEVDGILRQAFKQQLIFEDLPDALDKFENAVISYHEDDLDFCGNFSMDIQQIRDMIERKVETNDS